MRRKVIARMLLTLILANMLALLYNAGMAETQSNTIYIRPDGSIDPPTSPIQRDGNTYTFTDNIYETIVVQRDNIIVDGNGYTLQGEGSGTGIDLSNRNNVTIKNTHITGWDHGVHLYNLSSANNISDNNLTNNIWRGILVSISSSNIISRNKVVNNVGEGISLWHTNTTNVTGNIVSNNGEDGIVIDISSFNNTIINNTVSNNSHAGISAWEISRGNTIRGNNITENVWVGIYISWATASGNRFYHNNLNNTLQVFTVEATNIWDNGYPSGGNHWSDYNGQDADGDGIGDTPYVIDTSNQDNYPLMNPWTPQAYDIATVNVTSFKTVVGQGYTLNINATVANQGSYTQTFNVTAYANTTVIETETVTLESRYTTTITFRWDTTGVPYGNYTMSAVAEAVPCETRTADNTYTDGVVVVTVPGDVNGDRVVDLLDASAISAHWYPGPPVGPLGYSSNADINNDGEVNLLDATVVSANWKQTW